MANPYTGLEFVAVRRVSKAPGEAVPTALDPKTASAEFIDCTPELFNGKETLSFAEVCVMLDGKFVARPISVVSVIDDRVMEASMVGFEHDVDTYIVSAYAHFQLLF